MMKTTMRWCGSLQATTGTVLEQHVKVPESVAELENL
jgi:hypothetical protein